MLNMRMSLAVAAVGFGLLVGAWAPVQAAPLSVAPLISMSQQATDQAGGSAVQKASWRSEFCWRHPGNWRCREARVYHHCARWRDECGSRWGWHNWQFRRCLRRHDC